MQIISTIRVGHRIVTESQIFEVYGSMKARSGYKYLVVDTATKQKAALGREDVLQAQREGSARVVA